MSVIDIGANIGQFSVASLNLWEPKFQVAIEPFRKSYDKLVLALPKKEYVKTFMCAIGDEAKRLPFHVSRHSHSNSLLEQHQAHMEAFPEAKVQEQVEVEVRTLDEIINQFDLPRPALLKIDVQGYEMQVLKGGLKSLEKIDYILLEASMKPMYVGENTFSQLNNYLERSGFIFARPVDFLEDPNTGEVLQMDCLYIRKNRTEHA